MNLPSKYKGNAKGFDGFAEPNTKAMLRGVWRIYNILIQFQCLGGGGNSSDGIAIPVWNPVWNPVTIPVLESSEHTGLEFGDGFQSGFQSGIHHWIPVIHAYWIPVLELGMESRLESRLEFQYWNPVTMHRWNWGMDSSLESRLEFQSTGWLEFHRWKCSTNSRLEFPDGGGGIPSMEFHPPFRKFQSGIYQTIPSMEFQSQKSEKSKTSKSQTWHRKCKKNLINPCENTLQEPRKTLTTPFGFFAFWRKCLNSIHEFHPPWWLDLRMEFCDGIHRNPSI